jgi:hypothetical protein
VYVLHRKVKRRLHEPKVDRQVVINHARTRTGYPRGPPLRTSLSKSKPDMRTDAPLLMLPKTFSAQIAFSACYGGLNAGRPTIWYFAVFKNQFARVTSTHTDLVKLLMRREPFEATLNDKRRYAFRSFFWVRFRIYNERRRNGTVCNPGVGRIHTQTQF